MFEPDFEDFIKLLFKHQVNYLIIGGYAMAYHGKPRYTGDLDIWIDISPVVRNSFSNFISIFYG